jgi:hypothetical protein
MEIPSGYGQANFLFEGASLPYGAQTTIGFEVGVGFAGDPTDAAHEFFDAYGANSVYSSIAQGVNLVGVSVKFGPSATGPSGIWTDTWNGTATGGAAAPNTAWLVRKVTALGGHAGRGRMYWPGVPEEEVDDAGTIASGTRGTFEGKIGDMFAALVLEDLNPVLFHGPQSPVSAPTLITGYAVDSRVATQRRRLRR